MQQTRSETQGRRDAQPPTTVTYLEQNWNNGPTIRERRTKRPIANGHHGHPYAGVRSRVVHTDLCSSQTKPTTSRKYSQVREKELKFAANIEGRLEVAATVNLEIILHNERKWNS